MNTDWPTFLDKSLPILTFILGLVGSWITDALRDNRAYRISRKREYVEFQTRNYIALQEALRDMGRAAGRVLEHKRSLVEEDRPLHTGAGEELRSVVAQVLMLEQRCEKSAVRTAIKEARSKVASFGMQGGYNEGTITAFEMAIDALTKTQERVGKELRDLFGPADAC